MYDEVGRRRRPSPDQGHSSRAHEQWEGHPKYTLLSPRGRGAAAIPLTLLNSALSDLTLPVSSMLPRLPSPRPKSCGVPPVPRNDCECGNLSRGGTVPSHSKDHTQDKLAREQRTASENRKEDAARMSAGSLHEIAHTMEHVFSVSRFLLSSSVLLFSDKSRDLSQLPHFSLFRLVFAAAFKLRIMCFKVIDTSQIKPSLLFRGH